jgi:hypothetical protein
MKTIRQALAKCFDSTSIDAIQRFDAGGNYDLIDTHIDSATLLVTKDTGALQFSCGGTAIAAFKRANTHPIYLVVSDEAGRIWDERSHSGGRGMFMGPRPFERLVLVQTA